MINSMNVICLIFSSAEKLMLQHIIVNIQQSTRHSIRDLLEQLLTVSFFFHRYQITLCLNNEHLQKNQIEMKPARVLFNGAQVYERWKKYINIAYEKSFEAAGIVCWSTHVHSFVRSAFKTLTLSWKLMNEKIKFKTKFTTFSSSLERESQIESLFRVKLKHYEINIEHVDIIGISAGALELKVFLCKGWSMSPCVLLTVIVRIYKDHSALRCLLGLPVAVTDNT